MLACPSSVYIKAAAFLPAANHQLHRSLSQSKLRTAEPLKATAEIYRDNSYRMFYGALLSLLSMAPVLALAAPITTTGHGDAWQYGTGGGIIGFIVLILDVMVISR